MKLRIQYLAPESVCTFCQRCTDPREILPELDTVEWCAPFFGRRVLGPAEAQLPSSYKPERFVSKWAPHTMHPKDVSQSGRRVLSTRKIVLIS